MTAKPRRLGENPERCAFTPSDADDAVAVDGFLCRPSSEQRRCANGCSYGIVTRTDFG